MSEVSCFVKDGVLVVSILEPALIKDWVLYSIRRQIEDLLAQHSSSRLLLDFRNVTMAGSATLGMLIRLKSKNATTCRIALCALQPAVREPFRLTHLDRVFEIYDDFDAGVAALQVPCDDESVDQV